VSKLSRVAIFAALVAGLGTVAASAAPRVQDLPDSFILSPAGVLTRLHAGTTYRASRFPLGIRVTPPDGSWTGAQWKANTYHPDEIARRHLTCSTNPGVCKPPYYGWVAIGKGGAAPARAPRALILVMTGFGRTLSPTATMHNLQTRGRGATYQPVADVEVAGYHGLRLDGVLTGPRHVFVPFSPPSHKARAIADAIEISGAGHAFRIEALNVRGKTVVVFVGSLVMSADEFTAFLPQSDRLLGSLRFPARKARTP